MPQAAVGSFFNTYGPKEVFVRFRGTGTWQFLGTAITSPDYNELPHYIPVLNDYGGRSIPVQLVYDGTEASLSIVLSRFDLNVARNLRDYSKRTGTAALAGKDGNVTRGSLVLGVTDFELVVKNTYFGTVNATAGMVAARLFYSATLDAYRENGIGTRVDEIACVFGFHTPMGVDKSFSLYTEDATEIGASNLVSN